VRSPEEENGVELKMALLIFNGLQQFRCVCPVQTLSLFKIHLQAKLFSFFYFHFCQVFPVNAKAPGHSAGGTGDPPAVSGDPPETLERRASRPPPQASCLCYSFAPSAPPRSQSEIRNPKFSNIALPAHVR
jgi:hypothetical protein